jgi:hypothetical protein
VKFSIMHDGTKKIDACEEPHEFSLQELAEFTRIEVELQPMPSDYTVEIAPGIVCLASEISPRLVEAQ